MQVGRWHGSSGRDVECLSFCHTHFFLPVLCARFTCHGKIQIDEDESVKELTDVGNLKDRKETWDSTNIACKLTSIILHFSATLLESISLLVDEYWRIIIHVEASVYFITVSQRREGLGWEIDMNEMEKMEEREWSCIHLSFLARANPSSVEDEHSFILLYLSSNHGSSYYMWMKTRRMGRSGTAHCSDKTNRSAKRAWIMTRPELLVRGIVVGGMICPRVYRLGVHVCPCSREMPTVLQCRQPVFNLEEHMKNEEPKYMCLGRADM